MRDGPDGGEEGETDDCRRKTRRGDRAHRDNGQRIADVTERRLLRGGGGTMPRNFSDTAKSVTRKCEKSAAAAFQRRFDAKQMLASDGRNGEGRWGNVKSYE